MKFRRQRLVFACFFNTLLMICYLPSSKNPPSHFVDALRQQNSERTGLEEELSINLKSTEKARELLKQAGQMRRQYFSSTPSAYARALLSTYRTQLELLATLGVMNRVLYPARGVDILPAFVAKTFMGIDQKLIGEELLREVYQQDLVRLGLEFHAQEFENVLQRCKLVKSTLGAVTGSGEDPRQVSQFLDAEDSPKTLFLKEYSNWVSNRPSRDKFIEYVHSHLKPGDFVVIFGKEPGLMKWFLSHGYVDYIEQPDIPVEVREMVANSNRQFDRSGDSLPTQFVTSTNIYLHLSGPFQIFKKQASTVVSDSGMEELAWSPQREWSYQGRTLGEVRNLVNRQGEIVGRAVIAGPDHVEWDFVWNPDIERPDFPQWQHRTDEKGNPISEAEITEQKSEVDRLFKTGKPFNQWKAELDQADPNGLNVLYSNGTNPNLHQPLDFLISAGNVIRQLYARRDYPLDGKSFWAFIFSEGVPRVGRLKFDGDSFYDELSSEKVWNALPGVPIVEAGEDVTNQIKNFVGQDGQLPHRIQPNEVVWSIDRRTPRSGIGVTADGRIILMSITANITAGELAQKMMEAGAMNAIHLGGSADVHQWVAGEEKILRSIADQTSEHAGQIGRPLNQILVARLKARRNVDTQL